VREVMEIQDGYVKLDKPTTQIFIWIEERGFKTLAKIVKAKQDEQNRVYLIVREGY
jgi:hypothetical protein